MEAQKFYEFIQRNQIGSILNKQIKCLDAKNSQTTEITDISLSFNNQQILQNEYEILRSGLIQFDNLTHFQMTAKMDFKFNYQYLIINVSDALKTLNNLTHLSLNIQALINPEGAIKLGQAISYLSNLLYLDLDIGQNVNICDSGSIEIAKALQCLKNLEHLALKANSFNKIGERGFNAFSQSIADLAKLIYLEFLVYSNNNFEKKGQSKVDISLKNLTQLKHFNFNMCSYPEQIQNKHFIQKAKTLGFLNQLTNLEIEIQDLLKEDYFIYLSESLAKLENARSIKLKLRKLAYTDSQSAVKLGKGLSKLEQLNLLSISIHTIKIEEIQGLALGIKQIQSLTNLALEFPRMIQNDNLEVNLWQGFSNLKALTQVTFLLKIESSIQLALELSQLNIRTYNITVFDEIKAENYNPYGPKIKYFELIFTLAKYKNLNHLILYIDDFVFLKKTIMRKLKKLVYFKFAF
ncbi:hypothetical protein ABPG74_021061 [Tetrahymena malaccensis]